MESSRSKKSSASAYAAGLPPSRSTTTSSTTSIPTGSPASWLDIAHSPRQKGPMPKLVSHPDEVKIVTSRFGQGAAKIDRYLELGGYAATRKCLEKGPEWISEEMKASNLRGRGGAGFPTGMKWSFAPKQSAKPRYVLVNGDE